MRWAAVIIASQKRSRRLRAAVDVGRNDYRQIHRVPQPRAAGRDKMPVPRFARTPAAQPVPAASAMSTPPEGVIIKGVTRSGRAFRPSDWAERLCGVLSTFGGDQQM